MSQAKSGLASLVTKLKIKILPVQRQFRQSDGPWAG